LNMGVLRIYLNLRNMGECMWMSYVILNVKVSIAG
jgi:hypothetical protein